MLLFLIILLNKLFMLKISKYKIMKDILKKHSF